MPYNYFWSSDNYERPAYSSEDLEIEYKGFKVKKDKDYGIYSIVAPLGKTLHRSLLGGFTRMQLVEQQIDDFLKNNPASEAVEDKQMTTHVGRPTHEEAKERRRLGLERKLAELLKDID